MWEATSIKEIKDLFEKYKEVEIIFVDSCKIVIWKKQHEVKIYYDRGNYDDRNNAVICVFNIANEQDRYYNVINFISELYYNQPAPLSEFRPSVSTISKTSLAGYLENVLDVDRPITKIKVIGICEIDGKVVKPIGLQPTKSSWFSILLTIYGQENAILWNGSQYYHMFAFSKPNERFDQVVGFLNHETSPLCKSHKLIIDEAVDLYVNSHGF